MNELKKSDYIKFGTLLAIIVFYYFITNKFYTSPLDEIRYMKVKINATYELIDELDNFKEYQKQYNNEIIYYLTNINEILLDLENDSLINDVDVINRLNYSKEKIDNYIHYESKNENK